MIISTANRLTRKRPSAQPCRNNPEKKARPGSPFHSLADEKEFESKLDLAKKATPKMVKKWGSFMKLAQNHTLAELAQMRDISRTGPKVVKVEIE